MIQCQRARQLVVSRAASIEEECSRRRTRTAAAEAARGAETKTAEPVTTVAAPAEALALLGQQCKALWATDGKLYKCKIFKALGGGNIQVEYSGYNEFATVKISAVTMLPPGGGGGGKGQAAGGQKGGKGGQQQQQQQQQQPAAPAKVRKGG